MKNRKIISLFLVLIFLCICIVGCGKKAKEEDTAIKIPGLNISWKMNKEEVENTLGGNKSGTSLSSDETQISISGENCGEVFDIPLSEYICSFDSAGKLNSVNLSFDGVTYDQVIEEFTRRFGERTSILTDDSSETAASEISVWELDSQSISVSKQNPVSVQYYCTIDY